MDSQHPDNRVLPNNNQDDSDEWSGLIQEEPQNQKTTQPQINHFSIKSPSDSLGENILPNSLLQSNNHSQYSRIYRNDYQQDLEDPNKFAQKHHYFNDNQSTARVPADQNFYYQYMYQSLLPNLRYSENRKTPPYQRDELKQIYMQKLTDQEKNFNQRYTQTPPKIKSNNLNERLVIRGNYQPGLEVVQHQPQQIEKQLAGRMSTNNPGTLIPNQKPDYIYNSQSQKPQNSAIFNIEQKNREKRAIAETQALINKFQNNNPQINLPSRLEYENPLTQQLQWIKNFNNGNMSLPNLNKLNNNNQPSLMSYFDQQNYNNINNNYNNNNHYHQNLQGNGPDNYNSQVPRLPPVQIVNHAVPVFIPVITKPQFQALSDPVLSGVHPINLEQPFYYVVKDNENQIREKILFEQKIQRQIQEEKLRLQREQYEKYRNDPRFQKELAELGMK